MNDEAKLAPTFSIPGPGGSLGKCALCGETFLHEILFGETVAMITCSWCPNQGLPMHQACADKIEGSKLATDLPPGPLRTMWERSQDAQVEREVAECWRCFFCDEVFTDRKEAWLHFGEENCTTDVPACVDPLRADEKERLAVVKLLIEGGRELQSKLDEMDDWQERYDSLQSEIRQYFGQDCDSMWAAGDRYKNALARVGDLEAELSKLRNQLAQQKAKEEIKTHPMGGSCPVCLQPLPTKDATGVGKDGDAL